MTGPDGSRGAGRPDRGRDARPRSEIASLVAAGHEVVLTHGNGPQVGNLLVKNEIAAAVVPPVPLDWCGAQTQGTIGFILLERARARAGRASASPSRPAAAGQPHAGRQSTTPASPSRPSRSDATCPPRRPQVLMDHGEIWQDRGEKGWRRVVGEPGAARGARGAGDPRAARRRADGRSPAAGAASPSCARPTGRCAASRPSSTRTWPPCVLARARRRRRAGDRHRRRARHGRLRHARTPGRSARRRPPSWPARPPRATSRAARWARRSRPSAGSSRAAAPSPSSPASPASTTPCSGDAGTVVRPDPS